MSSVRVAVRVRPLNKREIELNSSVIIQVDGNITKLTNSKLGDISSHSTSSGSQDSTGRVKHFTYDYSYCSMDDSSPDYASQQMVFEDLGAEVVESAFLGYNACIFAYGQTGAGKTFTMMGSPDNPGLTPRICENLFGLMTDTETTYKTEISYMEIYNERVRDLLRDRRQAQLNLRVREHPKDGPYVQDLSRHMVTSYSDIERLLAEGNMRRTTAMTNMNDRSSRSHAIFSIVFTQAKFNDDIPSEVHSKMHLVDLAGSERADSAGTAGDRLKEGASINKSLVTLGSVISSLADLSSRDNLSPAGTPRRNTFIPYRDSILTWLLKDSLGGNAKTIMIAERCDNVEEQLSQSEYKENIGPSANTSETVESTSSDLAEVNIVDGARASVDMVDKGSAAEPNVKEKAQKINSQSEGQAALRPSAGSKSKRDRESRCNNMTSEDTSGDYDFSLSTEERDWMLKSAVSDYHPMAKILQSMPQLASKRDFITGYTALHWAAKNGNMDVVKLLCGTYEVSPNIRSQGGYTPLHLAALHGREDVVELLVKTYRADANIRDYGGRKAKQLLGSSASGKVQQVLQPAPRKSQAPSLGDDSLLQRTGSYSSRVAKTGHFGLNPGAAVRDSWVGGGSKGDSPSTSPAQKRRPVTDPSAVMPPPRELPAVVRHKPTSSRVRDDQETSHSDSEARRSGSETSLHGSDSTPNVGTLV